MKNTISDIAKIAGVAKSTVSRYLNGGSVSEATRRKIEHVIKETGYIPNSFAQSLKAKKTSMIGAVVPRLDSFASSQTVTGMDEALRESGYQLLIINTSQDLSREIEALYDLARQKISGIVLFATQITTSHLTAIEEIGIPVILLGQQHQDVHSIIYDDFAAGYDIGRYILAKGHRDIAYLGVTEKDVAVGVQRKLGFQQALKEHGGASADFYESGFRMSAAVEAASDILGSRDRQPSAIVCATDNIALGVMKAAHMRGIRIPEDISVTGFGGYDVTEVIHPGLTTIKYGYAAAGRLAARHVIKLVQEEHVDPLTVLSYEFMERESVDNRK
ncbi:MULTISPECIES: LacI family DNA-binding transcriptional regulator [Paenibacillus]|uniref:LacI family DNA-binding transcriptional regulator n=1 Tax=Paenibacillus campinasensis TaxID=66347 RepID=A0A268EYI3_9BACL|nr:MULTISPECIES: LacI family DNA-binding transcriptional regulator [Paenibacillus]MUG65328.1 LacI family DNA-binding transcriptional regulator [Paenibacillus campinasensis]PAD78172.1 LacI family transcriptional regulator [Paenibacillus campinasensis]PAK48473.1 LacI family transcriptional regulator [Paenibacillus sp. 7541]